LVGRLFEASISTMDVASVYLGDRLGLYRALHDRGPATAVELAGQAGIDERYAREWLEQQAATGILDVEDASDPAEERRFSFPSAYAEVLLDPESPSSLAPLVRSAVACSAVLPRLVDAFRTGGGIPWEDYGPDMIEAQGDFNRPWLVHRFGSEILPGMPDLHARLTRTDAPARVADVACGVGWAAISVARTYPAAKVDGFDLDPSSIRLARQNAEHAGVADRVSFQRRDGADAESAGEYDLAVIIEAVHDMANPVAVLSGVRSMLRPDGVLLVADEKTQDQFTAPADDLERMLYGFSILTCLPAAMTERPTAATGTVIREDTMRRYAAEAGFTDFERLDEPELDALRFYRLSASPSQGG